MKLHDKINHILLGTLWTLAIVLLLDFWLNTSYNFNIFSAAHWEYVAMLQASNQQIATGFYIAITLAISLCILGLYIIFRPRFRKIVFKPAQTIESSQEPKPTIKTTNATVTQIQQTTPKAPVIQRPPHLHIQINQPIIAPKQNTTPEQKHEQNNQRYTHEIREIFEKNNYKVLKPKTIKNTPLSLIALGTSEVLWLGATDISHQQMLDIMTAFKSVFQETLDDIEIDVNAFIINPTDTESNEAIIDFANLDELSNAINEHPNPDESDADRESGNMDAFSGYIETVLTYLGNK